MPILLISFSGCDLLLFSGLIIFLTFSLPSSAVLTINMVD